MFKMEQNNPFYASFYSFLKNKREQGPLLSRKPKTSHQPPGFINTEEISKLKTEEVEASVMLLCITVHWEWVQHCRTFDKTLQ